MDCPVCQGSLTKSMMWHGEEFDYCKSCKKELSELLKDTCYDSEWPADMDLTYADYSRRNKDKK